MITSLPNILTIFRCLATLFLFATPAMPHGAWIAAIVFALAGISDFADGYIARRIKATSDFGRVMDPVADKFMIFGTAMFVVWQELLGGWDLIPVLIIVFRELTISGLREYLVYGGKTLHVSALAKWKTTMQILALQGYLAAEVLPFLSLPGQIMLWIAAVLTIITGWDYLKHARTYADK